MCAPNPRYRAIASRGKKKEKPRDAIARQRRKPKREEKSL